MSQRFMRGAGEVNDPDHKLWGPMRWVTQMIQYLVAMILLTIGKGIEAIFKGEKGEEEGERGVRLAARPSFNFSGWRCRHAIWRAAL